MKTIIRSISIKCNFMRMREFKMADEAFVIHTRVCVLKLPLLRDTLLSMFTRKSKIKKADKHCINWRNILCINEQ